MKKLLLSAILFTSMGALAQGSNIVIQQDGAGPNLAGTTVDIVINPFEVNGSGDAGTSAAYEPHFIITNNTGADETWRITVWEMSVPTSWDDQICWPPNCFPTGTGDLYTTPNSGASPAPTVLDGTSDTEIGGFASGIAEMKPRIIPDYSSNSSATYRYYVTDLSGNYLDSVTLNLSYPLSVKENKSINLSIAPNPASDYVKVNLGNSVEGTVQVVDVLGNIVYSSKVEGVDKISVAEFRNGVYFVTINSPGYKTVTKKLVVRH